MPSREGHHPSLCATCNLWSTSCCQASQLTLSPTSSHCSQLEPFHAPADELQHGVRQWRVERAQTLQSAQHLHRFKGFIAMQKSYVNHILQLMLKSPLHLPCEHVLSVPHLVLVQGTPAPLLGALCMAWPRPRGSLACVVPVGNVWTHADRVTCFCCICRLVQLKRLL